MVVDGATVDQRLAAVEHQCRNAAQWIPGLHLGTVVEAGQRPLLKRHAVDLERDGDAARKRRAVQSDQQHFSLVRMWEELGNVVQHSAAYERLCARHLGSGSGEPNVVTRDDLICRFVTDVPCAMSITDDSYR
jgi:hypothetical protein